MSVVDKRMKTHREYLSTMLARCRRISEAGSDIPADDVVSILEKCQSNLEYLTARLDKMQAIMHRNAGLSTTETQRRVRVRHGNRRNRTPN